MGRAMAIDYGSRRVGVALSDPLRIIAQPFETLYWNGKNPERILERLSKIIEENNVEEVLLGSPRRTDGVVSASQQAAEMFGTLFFEKTGIAPIYVDERYTTVIASRYLIETGVQGKDRKNIIDQMAAQIILREYLDNHRPEN
jgi:putative Holliday junction resolvase